MKYKIKVSATNFYFYFRGAAYLIYSQKEMVCELHNETWLEVTPALLFVWLLGIISKHESGTVEIQWGFNKFCAGRNTPSVFHAAAIMAVLFSMRMPKLSRLAGGRAPKGRRGSHTHAAIMTVLFSLRRVVMAVLFSLRGRNDPFVSLAE